MIQPGNPIQRTELFDFKLIQAEPSVMNKLKAIYKDKKLDYEMWIESADSFEEITTKLKQYGYSNLPQTANPLAGWASIPSSAPLPKPSATMVRKKF